MAAAVIGVALLSVVGGIQPVDQMLDALLIGVAIAIAAPIGDLAESLVKRDLEVKDMGSVLPGHGGFLDRFDGLLFSLPTVWLMLLALDLAPVGSMV
jgi:phosphatidate cytidylyltransferase